MRSGPHHKNIGCLEARIRLTVVTRVSDQLSTGPRTVFPQSKPRVNSAISPVPTIREGLTVGSAGAARFLPFGVREDDGMVNLKIVTGGPLRRRAFRTRPEAPNRTRWAVCDDRAATTISAAYFISYQRLSPESLLENHLGSVLTWFSLRSLRLKAFDFPRYVRKGFKPQGLPGAPQRCEAR